MVKPIVPKHDIKHHLGSNNPVFRKVFLVNLIGLNIVFMMIVSRFLIDVR